MIDYTLYLVTDKNLSQGRTNLAVVESAIQGGVTCVQFRDKDASREDFITEAMLLKKILARYSIPLIINDRVDVAAEIDADGVHLGQNDMAIEEARELLGKSKIIGISAESLEDAIEAEKKGADYIAISPVFETATKVDTAIPLGLEGVNQIRRNVKISLVGIGGIKLENAAAIIKAGADGVAVVSAIVSAVSPEDASRQLLNTIESGLLLK